MTKSALAPIIGKDPQIIILGSMPSQVSLRKQQYYAHPQNAFWWLMSQMLKLSPELSYHQRCQALIDMRIAVWDVLEKCQRPGSLDSNIVRSSECVNGFSEFLSEYPSIKLLAFNGGAAKVIFMRHCTSVLTAKPDLTWRQLPSSSPAHASVSRLDKLQLWQESLMPHIG